MTCTDGGGQTTPVGGPVRCGVRRDLNRGPAVARSEGCRHTDILTRASRVGQGMLAGRRIQAEKVTIPRKKTVLR